MTFKDIVNNAISIINDILIPAVFALTILVFLWGIFRYIFAGEGEEDTRKARAIMLWGIIILAIMTSIWGILNLFQNTILEGVSGGGNSSQFFYNPTIPDSTAPGSQTSSGNFFNPTPSN